MSSADALKSGFQLRTVIDPPKVRERLRLEHGPAAGSLALLAMQLSDIDADQIDCKAEIHRLQSEIHRLQSHIIFLRNQERHLDEYKMCLRSLRSPVRKLPDEIMLWIFDLTCNMNYITSRKLRLIPALAISNVCLHWRDLAQSFPQLWSRVYITLPRAPGHLTCLPILKLFLNYSQQYPLTLEVGNTRVAVVPEYWLAVCVLLRTQYLRWQKVSLPRDPALTRELLTEDSLEYPLLTTLDFQKFDGPFSNGMIPNHLFPKLQSLSFCYFHAPPMTESRNRNVVWTNLTTLDIRLSVELGFLRMCSHLRELHLRQSYPAVRPTVPSVIAPSVRTLSLSCWSESRMTTPTFLEICLASFTFPSLRSLFIMNRGSRYRHDYSWSKNAMNDFISRSSFDLTTLHIESCPITDFELIDLLCQLPSLVHLVVVDSKVANDMPSPITPRLVQKLHAFCPSSGSRSSSVIPMSRRLQSLSFTFNGSDDKKISFDDRAFVDMIFSRWFPEKYANVYGLRRSSSDALEDGIACLRSVVMRFTKRNVPKKIYQPLKYLEAEGLRVAIVVKGSFLDL
ncbi:hypothetical protein J3R30DRAFT_3523028 [Lentinula aciculospora]|uniref:F-box domain-containing protein n=1 Tax=Lentinula aciculospora TaxID=153920 RepID=A0A9W9DIF2_9AGAR|nr:hypothetical protein J3R30DRAFT_3523028 [Lentinula aciculospora]